MVYSIASARPRRSGAVALLTGAGLLLQGCAGQSTASLSRSYDDPSDVCVAERRPIIELRSTEEQDRLRQAIAGAVVGGILAGGIAAATGNDNWLLIGGIGAGVGLLAGYTRAYLDQKAETAQTREELLASVDGDAQAERARLSQTARSVQDLRDCRRDQIAKLRTDIRDGILTGDAAREAALDLQSRARGDNRLISEVLGGADQRVDAYVDTTAAVSEVDAELLAAERRDKEARQARRKVGKTSKNVIASSDELKALKTDDAAAEAEADAEIAALLELTRTS